MSKRIVEFKGGAVTLMSLHAHSEEMEQIQETLNERVAQAPNFYRAAPVIVDLSSLPEASAETLQGIVDAVKGQSLQPIAARVESDAQRGWLSDIGLPTLRQAERESEISVPDEDAQSTTPSARPGETLIETQSPGRTVTRQVRSGQQHYAQRGDLVIVGGCSPGAELIADGNIHVYGPLRGRALCGVNGNEKARIFCMALEAELVSVAGHFKLLEQIPESIKGRAAQIWLEGDKLNIEPL